MKIPTSTVFCGLLAISPLHSAEPVESITVDALKKLSVVGKLGVPLGKLVEIKATVVAIGSLRSMDNRTYCLKVTSVGGKDLKKPAAYKFETIGEPSQPFGGSSLPNTLADLYRMKKHLPQGSITGMTEEKMNEVEAGYVGCEVTFRGYETGSYEGIPENMPERETWQGTGSFGFTSKLLVVSGEFLR